MTSTLFLLMLAVLFSCASGFRALVSGPRFAPSLAGSQRLFGVRVEVGTTREIPAGERKVVDTSAGAVIVTNVQGQYYAVNAKCPHLGLPMKKGAIEIQDGTPTITCNFHNSKFSLTDGSCKSWCTGVLGLPGTGFLAGAMGKMGGAEGSPATVYNCSVEGETVYLEL